MKYELYAPLSIEECNRRLTEKLENNSLFRGRGQLFSGWIREKSFSLRLARGARNPFAPYFQGTLEPTTEGTVLRGSFRIQAGAKWAAIIWLILWSLMPCGLIAIVEAVLISFLVAMGDSLRELGPELYQTILTIPVTILLFPLVGLVVGIGFPALFIALRIGDRDQLIELLESILEVDDRSAT